MALGTVLASLPWDTIFKRGPVLVNSASRLVRSLRPGEKATAEASLPATGTDPQQRIAQLETRIASLEDNLARTAALLEDLAKAHAEAVIKARGLFNLVKALGGALVLMSFCVIWLAVKTA